MPDTGSYMVAAYIVVAVMLLGYVAMMWRRGKS